MCELMLGVQVHTGARGQGEGQGGGVAIQKSVSDTIEPQLPYMHV